MTDTFKNQTKVTFTLNGKEVDAPEGENLIEACSNAGVDIPHFCYHNRMNPVGMCRICLLYTSPSPRDKRQSRMPSSA